MRQSKKIKKLSKNDIKKIANLFEILANIDQRRLSALERRILGGTNEYKNKISKRILFTPSSFHLKGVGHLFFGKENP